MVKIVQVKVVEIALVFKVADDEGQLLVEELLEFLVDEVDPQLLEGVQIEDFETGNVEHSDEVVTINSIGVAVLAGASDDTNLTGAYEVGDLAMTQVTGQFPILRPDINSFGIVSTAASTFEVTIRYRKRFRK